VEGFKMALKRDIVKTLLITLLVGVGMAGAKARIASQGGQPFASSFYLRPNFAQFITSDFVLNGNTEGLQVIEIDSGSVVSKALEGVAVTTMMANPHREGHVAVATEMGDVFFAIYENGELHLEKVDQINDSPLTIIKSIYFHEKEADRILFADQKRIAMCKYEDNKVTIQKLVRLDQTPDLLVMVFPDNLDSDWFLISTTRDGRYRGNWNTGEIVSIPEDILEHGYKITANGISYYAWGDNQEFTNIKFINIRPVFAKKHPSNPDTYLFATIGMSPIRLKINRERNHYDIEYLFKSIHLSFSIDTDRNNPERIIFTTSKGIFFREDNGGKWNRIGENE
jgi:hypothetical protein